MRESGKYRTDILQCGNRYTRRPLLDEAVPLSWVADIDCMNLFLALYLWSQDSSSKVTQVLTFPPHSNKKYNQ
jgi:hypothetical protein